MSKTTNNITHNIDKSDKAGNYSIEIRLNDECKNGHEDFAITATFWEIGKARTDRNMLGGGACHDEILKVMPELELFTELHLSDAKGAPMYAIENGLFHKSDLKTFKRYLRLTNEEAKELVTCESEVHLYMLLESKGIIKRWKMEAKKAIKWLENATNETFESTATRSNLKKPSNKEVTKTKKQLASGHFSPDKIQKRAKAAKVAEKRKLIEELRVNAKSEKKETDQELAVKLEVLKTLDNLRNVIYYNHSNKLKFNWLDFEKVVTEEKIEEIRRNMDYSKVPKGIKIVS